MSSNNIPAFEFLTPLSCGCSEEFNKIRKREAMGAIFITLLLLETNYEPMEQNILLQQDRVKLHTSLHWAYI